MWILLVEDSRDGVTLTQHALRKAGIVADVVVARSGQRAFDILFGNAPDAPEAKGSPGLILLDLKMPGLDGLEVLERLRSEERTRYVPVVVLTSSREPSDVMASYAMGANSYVRKPVNFSHFIQVVGSVCGYWLGMNATPPQHEYIVPPSAGVGGPSSDDAHDAAVQGA